MCNPQEESVIVLNQLGGRKVEEVFSREFIERVPPYHVQKNHCLSCGEPLSYQEMYPPGKMPRYMCNSCYERIALSGPKYTCLTCGEPLSRDLINAQNRNPRELKYALHPGACKNYHFMLAGIVLGVPFRFNSVPLLPERSSNVRLEEGFPLRRMEDWDIVDVKPIEPRRQVKLLKLLE